MKNASSAFWFGRTETFSPVRNQLLATSDHVKTWATFHSFALVGRADHPLGAFILFPLVVGLIITWLSPMSTPREPKVKIFV